MFPFKNNYLFPNGVQNLIKQFSQSDQIEKIIHDSFSRSLFNPIEMLQRHVDTDQMNEKEDKHVNINHVIDPEIEVHIFETHDDVFVRVRIEEPAQLRKLKLSYTSNQLIIKGLPKDESRHVFTLPAIVKRKGVTTSYRDDYLQLQIPKRMDTQYTEIDVPYVE